MSRKPFIGMTGFTCRQQVEAVVANWPAAFTSHHLMVGVLADWRSLADEPVAYPNRYPMTEIREEVFVDDPRCLNLVHLSIDSGQPLQAQIEAALISFGPHVDGVHLNAVWPDPNVLAQVRHTYRTQLGGERDLCISLQVGAKAMERYHFDPDSVALAVKRYRGIIDYAVIDPTGGKGRLEPADVEHHVNAVAAAVEHHLGVGFAGHLTTDSLMQHARMIRRLNGSLSFDAQRSLRNRDDVLDVDRANEFAALGRSLVTDDS